MPSSVAFLVEATVLNRLKHSVTALGILEDMASSTSTLDGSWWMDFGSYNWDIYRSFVTKISEGTLHVAS